MNKYSKFDNTSYILGISLIVEALLLIPEQINKVYLSSKANSNKELDKLLNLCKTNNIPIEENDLLIQKLSIKENCYGIGIFNKYHKQLSTNKHLVLYGFNDEGELGTVLRSATSFDFEDVVLINSSIDIFDPKVIRASMGSFFHLNIKEYTSFNEYLKDYQYTLYPFASYSKHELSSLTFKEPFSIIIPQKLSDLNNMFENTYYVSHITNNDISLGSLSSIILNYVYHQTLSDKNISYKAH